MRNLSCQGLIPLVSVLFIATSIAAQSDSNGKARDCETLLDQYASDVDLSYRSNLRPMGLPQEEARRRLDSNACLTSTYSVPMGDGGLDGKELVATWLSLEHREEKRFGRNTYQMVLGFMIENGADFSVSIDNDDVKVITSDGLSRRLSVIGDDSARTIAPGGTALLLFEETVNSTSTDLAQNADRFDCFVAVDYRGLYLVFQEGFEQMDSGDEKSEPEDTTVSNETVVTVPPRMVMSVSVNVPARGLQGDVWVRSLVDETGAVVDTELAESSGHEYLDNVALTVAPLSRFSPAVRDNQPVSTWVTCKVGIHNNFDILKLLHPTHRVTPLVPRQFR